MEIVCEAVLEKATAKACWMLLGCGVVYCIRRYCTAGTAGTVVRLKRNWLTAVGTRGMNGVTCLQANCSTKEAAGSPLVHTSKSRNHPPKEKKGTSTPRNHGDTCLDLCCIKQKCKNTKKDGLSCPRTESNRQPRHY